MTIPFHILLLSAGTLLSQNILDSLEGRDRVRITGINADGNNDRIFRCDKIYLAPLTQ